MNTIDKKLRQQIIRAPSIEYQVIVRTDNSFKTIVDEFVRRGVVIHNKFRFIRAVVISATGYILLTLAKNPHIIYIELDGQLSI